MRHTASAFIPSVFCALLLVQPVHAQSLLDGVVGSGDSGGGNSIVGVDSGSAGSDSTVNVGIGSGGGDSDNLLDLNLGGSGETGLNANARSSGEEGTTVTIGTEGAGGVEGTVNLLGPDNVLTGSVGAGGSGGLDIELGIGIGGGGAGGPGGNGGGGGGGGAGTAVAGLSASDLACMGPEAAQLLQLAQQSTAPTQWQQASNVQIVPITVCPEARQKLIAALQSSGIGSTLWGAAARDALIAASLSRTSYDAQNVLAVQRNGSQLTVYVI